MSKKSVAEKRTRRNLESKRNRKLRKANKTQQQQAELKFKNVDDYVASFLSDAHELLRGKESLRMYLANFKKSADEVYAKDPTPHNEKVVKLADKFLVDLAGPSDRVTNVFRSIGKVSDCPDNATKLATMTSVVTDFIDLRDELQNFTAKVLDEIQQLRKEEHESAPKLDASNADLFLDDTAEDKPETTAEEAPMPETETSVGKLVLPEGNTPAPQQDGEIDLDEADAQEAIDKLRAEVSTPAAQE